MTTKQRVTPATLGAMDCEATQSPTSKRRGRLSGPERRTSILSAAAQVFTNAGYQRARMSDVAAVLGVTEPVIFQNFGSKAALYAAVLEQAAEELCAMLRTQIDSGVSVAEFLATVLGPGHIHRMHSPGSPGVLFADAVALTADPEIEEVARRSLRKVAKVLAQLFALGQERGEVRAGLDPATAAWGLLSFLASHGFRSAIMPNRGVREDELGQMMMQLLTEPR